MRSPMFPLCFYRDDSRTLVEVQGEKTENKLPYIGTTAVSPLASNTAGLVAALQQIFAALFFQVFHDLAHLLGAGAGGDQERVGRIHDHHVPDPDERHHFAAGVHEVVLRVDADRVAVDGVSAFVAKQEFVDGIPASHVVPSEIGGGNPADAGGFL